MKKKKRGERKKEWINCIYENRKEEIKDIKIDLRDIRKNEWVYKRDREWRERVWGVSDKVWEMKNLKERKVIRIMEKVKKWRK